ncbi:alpha/beta hydrolase [Frigidibacter oleivorans]|uniref:alpha/beta hydrolase n=1 Tax=Frigidibacter oleivorans TaxID=2487129 RepID=UPI001EEA2A90|nr:alpha/beta hydrolase-fold protein [Frigidibacter oleivorans]
MPRPTPSRPASPQPALGRRALIGSALAAAAMPALLPRALRAQPARGNDAPAERIDDPRAIAFDLGPAEAPWRIFVGLPAVAAPAGGHSLLLAVDGNATFPLLWHARERLAPDAPVLIAGIGYPTDQRFDLERRFLDLTPATAADYLGRRQGTPTGGRDALLAMIEDRLLPRLAADHGIDPAARSFYGHSLGGLFALHVLFRRPALFGAIAAADPSLWWNGGSVLQEEAAFRTGVAAAGGSFARPLQLLVQNSGQRPPRADGQPDPRGEGQLEAREMAARLAGIGGLSVRYRRLAETSHGSLIAPSLADALALHLGRPLPDSEAL